MKRFTAIALVVLAGFCAATSLQAQTNEARATVPFSFMVGSKTLPAGSYRFLAESSNLILIQNRYQPVAALSRVDAATDTSRNPHAHLVFRKYGDRYFLSEIRCARVALNGEIPRSKFERHMQQVEQATLPTDTVQVAAE